MPLKPRKGESQSDFMSRCMSETFGPDAPESRTQEQAVAICMDYWREAHGGKKPSDKAVAFYAAKQAPVPNDGESREDFFDRCLEQVIDADDELDEIDAHDICEMSWEENKAVRAKPREPVFHKTHTGAVQGFEFILSDDSPDRMGDIIASDGWDIASFKRNPIALFNHNPNFPIGKWHNLRVEKNALRGHLQMAPEGTSARIDEIRKLIEAGILQAVSVGFRPIESKPRQQKAGLQFVGEHFTKQELIETSLVSVPANPNALAVAKSLNVSPATLDLVFAKHGNRDQVRRRDFTAKHGTTSREGKGSAMSLAQRIIDIEQQIGNKTAELETHIASQDDSNVSDTQLERTNLLNSQLAQLQKQHDALVEAEKRIAGNIKANGGGDGNGHGRGALTVLHDQRSPGVGAPIIIKHSKKDWEPLDYLVHAGVITAAAKLWNIPADLARQKIYGDDEPTKVVFEWTQRAATAPAMTTVAGWAQELVQQIYADMMALLMPQSVYPRLSAKGLSLNFGRAGKIVLPTRSRTPTIAGSFVGEGMPIPVRQGAFTSQTFVPKKMAVITSFTREMEDHSIPAIEGVLREAIREDTAVALDSVLLDANAATAVRPAGILNGVAAITATTGGGLNALIGDIKNLIGALVASTYGNIRAPAWLMNPAEVLSASLVRENGLFPFKDEVGRGTLANIPIIDSATVPVKTVVLQDAADFVTMQGDNMRFEMSDQATLHFDDTNPADLVSGSPGTVATPQRSLFQTDSLALRMIFPVNWAIRRGGTVAWTQSVTW